MDEDYSAALTKWHHACSLASFIAMGPRSVLPDSDKPNAAPWWAPVVTLAMKFNDPDRTQSRCLYRHYPSPDGGDDAPLLIRLFEWDGASDRARLKAGAIEDLTTHLKYGLLANSNWKRIEPLVQTLEREVSIAYCAESLLCAATNIDAPYVSVPSTRKAPVCKTLVYGTSYIGVKVNWTPTSNRLALDDRWDDIWNGLAGFNVNVPAAPIVERFNIPPFGGYLDVPASELSKVQSFTTEPEYS